MATLNGDGVGVGVGVGVSVGVGVGVEVFVGVGVGVGVKVGVGVLLGVIVNCVTGGGPDSGLLATIPIGGSAVMLHPEKTRDNAIVSMTEAW
jgi:hypothetical protein